jgi:hypothetical protein
MPEEVDRLYLWIGYSLISVVVFAIIITSLVSISTGDKAYQDLVARDVSLLTSGVLSSNDNLVVEYSSPTERELYFSLSDDCVVKIGPEGTQFTYQEYYCLDNPEISKGDSGIKVDNINFELKDKIYIIHFNT